MTKKKLQNASGAILEYGASSVARAKEWPREWLREELKEELKEKAEGEQQSNIQLILDQKCKKQQSTGTDRGYFGIGSKFRKSSLPDCSSNGTGLRSG
ncbi:MAG: hypothetical protein ACLUD2_19390 [Clostridium sp.]